MSSMVRQDTSDLLEDCLNMMDEPTYTLLDEITTLSASTVFDHSKLAGEGVNVGVGADMDVPAAVVQPAYPSLPQYLSTDDSMSLPLSPELLPVPDALSPAASLFREEMQTPTPSSYYSPATPSSYDSITSESMPASLFMHEMQVLLPQQTPSPGPSELSVGSTTLDLSQPWEENKVVLLTLSPATTECLQPPSPAVQQQQAESPAPASFHPQPHNIPKKRGRKPKYPDGMAPSRRRPKKTKVYEMGPMGDETQEKKRKNAINAKKHRDQQKEQRQQLAHKLQEAIAEKKLLQLQIDHYRQREEQLLQLLRRNGIPISCM